MILFFTVFALSLSMLLTPIYAQTTIVGSDLGQNSYLRTELVLYQADDADGNYDYYFVKFTITDVKYGSKWWINICDLIMSIKAYERLDYTKKADLLMQYVSPSAGNNGSPGSVSISFYGIGVSVPIPGRSVSIETKSGNYIKWTASTWAPTFPVMTSTAGASIGFRVREGQGIMVSATSAAWWYTRIGVPKGSYSGYSPVVRSYDVVGD